MVATASSMMGSISARGMRARARIDKVWMVADATRASRPCRAKSDEAGRPLSPFGPADGRHRIVDDGLDFSARNAGAGADRQRVEGR
jgi:hypothetical protein